MVDIFANVITEAYNFRFRLGGDEGAPHRVGGTQLLPGHQGQGIPES